MIYFPSLSLNGNIEKEILFNKVKLVLKDCAGLSKIYFTLTISCVYQTFKDICKSASVPCRTVG